MAKTNILVVEDEGITAKDIQGSLQDLGYAVSAVVSSGEEAIKKAEEDNPDLVLMDIVLRDEMSGIEAADQIREDLNIPIVYLTAYADEKTLERAKITEPYGYIIKPFDDRELHTIIEMALHKHRMEIKLKKSEEKYRLIFENAKEGISIYEELPCGKRRLVECNPRYFDISGYSREELIQVGDTLKIQVSHNTPQQDAANMEKAQAVQPYSGTFSWIRPDGEENYVEYTAAPFNMEGKRFTVGIDHDVTERKRAEEEKAKLEEQLHQFQKMQAVGQLTAGVAHHFNNMLAAIMGNVELAKMRAPDNIQRYLETAITSSRRAADMIKDLMMFAKMEQVERQPVDINLVINDTAARCRNTFNKRIEITVESHDNLPLVLGNSTELEQVFFNLCLNARDALEDIYNRPPNIRIEVDKVSPNQNLGEYIQISVCDNGVGIDKETKERIFEPFFTTREVGKGTGLGLAIVYGAVKRHDGWVECQSEPGVGTTFKVYLPAYERATTKKEIEEVDEMPRGDETILLIDDEVMIRETTQLMLESYGYNVLVVADGVDGLGAFIRERNSIDLVVLDLSMPKMSGWEVLKEMLAIDQNVKVVISSGHFFNDSELKGAKAAIRKPFQWSTLLQTVRGVLDA